MTMKSLKAAVERVALFLVVVVAFGPLVIAFIDLSMHFMLGWTIVDWDEDKAFFAAIWTFFMVLFARLFDGRDK